jgi:hypothetical protein
MNMVLLIVEYIIKNNQNIIGVALFLQTWFTWMFNAKSKSIRLVWVQHCFYKHDLGEC